MVTRQLRLTSTDQIRKTLPQYIGKKINIVLCDRTVLFGELRSITDTELSFLNMRLKGVTLSLAQVNEIYLDGKE